MNRKAWLSPSLMAVLSFPLAVGCATGEARNPSSAGAGGNASGGTGGDPLGGTGTGGAGVAGTTGSVGTGAGGNPAQAGTSGAAGAAGAVDAGGMDAAAPSDAKPPGLGGPPTVQMIESPCLSVPDPDVAAGPTLVGVAIQWDAYFYKKDTGALDHQYTWKALRGGLISDTHIVYDVSSKHWFMTTIVDLGNNATGVQFMVSTDETATAWKLSVPIEMPRLIDDPQPTVTSDKVVVTESGACVWGLDKAALIAGNAPMVPAINCAVQQDNQLAAVKFGGTPPQTAYAITMADAAHINWVSTDGTPAAGNLKVTEHQLAVPPINEVPLAGITQGNIKGLESGQVKAMWQNNHIVWNKTVTCPTGMCVRSFDVDIQANTVKSDDFGMAGTQIFYGASGFDSLGNMWLLTADAKPAGFVGLALAGRSAAGQVSTLKEIVPGEAAIAGTGLIRFGDYVAASEDPVDGSTWLIGQYAAKAKGPLNPENNAGCKIVHVSPN